MPKLPRRAPSRVSAGAPVKNTPARHDVDPVSPIEAAEHQAAILIAANADMPLPERLFHGIYFTKQIFDECYQALSIRPTYIANSRYIRPSDLRKIVEHRAKDAFSRNSVSNGKLPTQTVHTAKDVKK